MTTELQVKAKRVQWKQAEVVTLADAFRKNGMAACVGAFPDRSLDEMQAKLEALGLYRLTDAQRHAIRMIVNDAHKETTAPLLIKALIKELRSA